MTIQEILDRAEKLRNSKNTPDEGTDCLYDLRKEIINSGFPYICRYHDKTNSRLEAPIQVFNLFYSATPWDFLTTGLFKNDTFSISYYKRDIVELVYGIDRNELYSRRLQFGPNNHLTKEEYEKLIIHPDREKLLEFLLADEASGDIAKQILSWA